MIGLFLTRGLVMVFGYAYPAYECYKTVERNKPDIEQLRFWCQYWILVAVLTFSERVGDTFISWVPMYSEAKLAFYIYLWYPKTKGTSYVYDSFFKPYVAKHETDIDRNLLELRTRAGDYAVLYWQRAASYGQTRIFEILQFIVAQSTPRPRPSRPQKQATRIPPKQKPTTKTPPASEEPPSPTASASLSDEEVEEVPESSTSQALKEVEEVPESSTSQALKEVEEVPESSTSQALKAAPSISSSSLQRSTSAPSEASNPLSSSETDKMQIEKPQISASKTRSLKRLMEKPNRDTWQIQEKNVLSQVPNNVVSCRFALS